MKLNSRMSSRIIHPEETRKTAAINTRAALSSFYIGTGGQDVASVANFLGVPGGRNWEREFTRKSPRLAKAIIDTVNGIVEASLLDEIVKILVSV